MIVHVLGAMTAGGNERLCLELARRAPPGLPQALLTIDPSPGGPLEGLFREIPGLRIIHVPYSRDDRARFVLRVAWVLRSLDPIGIISYPFGLHLLLSLAAKSVPRSKFICHVGNPPPADGPRRQLFRRIVLASRWLRAPLWFCSETVHERFLALGARLPENSRATPNGINVQALRRDALQGRTRRVVSRPVVSMVARLDSIKDHDTLLRAFAQVRERLGTVRLWIIGDGDRRGTLERQTGALGLTAAVDFLGARPDVATLLGQVDLFVFSTTPDEGFGIALAEAMAIGLPIVATDVAACREVLDGGNCGVLVPPHDAQAMAREIVALLEDPARAATLSGLAAARAWTEYDIGRCAQRYYGYLLGGRPPLTAA